MDNRSFFLKKSVPPVASDRAPPPQYASAERRGEQFMTADDFVCKFLGLYTEPNSNKDSIKLLGGILDTSKDGLISYAEFSAFEGLLCVPDALYRTAFQLFDTTGTGLVNYGTVRVTRLSEYRSANQNQGYAG